MTLNLEKCMTSLADKRPIFHSEADFQFALAWEIQQELLKQYSENDFGVRLEYPIEIEDKKANIDIVVFIQGQMIPIELKYKTSRLCKDKKEFFTEQNEEFRLKEQSAQNEGRYDFLKDIERIEKISQNRELNVNMGYTIWLVNNKTYWSTHNPDANYGNFNVIGIITPNKKLEWQHKTPATGSRQESITLKSEYTFEWVQYPNNIKSEQNSEFRYCLTKINKIQLS